VGVHIRTFTWDDTADVVALANASLLADGEAPHITASYLRQRYSVATAQLENSIVAVTEADEVVGANMTLFGKAQGKGLATLYIHPDWRTNNLGQRVVIAGDDRLLKHGARVCPPDQPLYLLRSVDARQHYQRDLLQTLDYSVERHFYGMALDLPDSIDIPPLAEGLSLRPFAPDDDAQARALHATYDSAFRDAWGQRQGTTFDSWKRTFMSADTDYSLWHTVWDDDADRLVAFTINLVDPAGIQQGKVRSLGVHPDYRQRGIAMTLLQHSFAQFITRDLVRAVLNVDGSADTNPLRLYQRAGMHQESHDLILRRILRGLAEDIDD
jgi:mycothiol synthase